MPLIGKREFVPQANPNPLPEEVYYNDVTNEIFTDYEPYLRRIDDINQSKWTCSITGKTGLTFLEACHSEYDAHATFHTIPEVLRKVLAVLMARIKSNSTQLALSLLYEFTNLRYFIGEEVQLLSPGRRRQDVIILKVFAPDAHESKNTIAYGLNPMDYEYLVGAVDEKNKRTELRLPASRLTRHKGKLTLGKIRLFLRTGLSIQKNRLDLLSFRDDFCKEIGLANIKWTDIFAGPEPNFVDDTVILKALGKKKATENLGPMKKGSKMKKPKPIILKKKSNILSKSKKKIQNIKKKKAIKDSVDKEKQKEIFKEAKKLYEESYKVWSEKRDDLLCDDLKELPDSLPIDIDFDLRHLKDAFMITEFANTFSSYITDFNYYFPDGISFRLMLDILDDDEIGGPYGALVQIIFNTILHSHSEGRKEERSRKRKDMDMDMGPIDIEIDNNLEMDVDSEENVDSNVPSNVTNCWVATHFTTIEQLSKLRLDQFTLSELLRIYILKIREVDRKTNKRTILMSDVELHLVKALTVSNFVELDLQSRLDLFNILIQDFFSIPEIMVKMDETHLDIYQLKTQIRRIKANHTRWLREHPIRNRIRKKKGAETNTVVDEASPEEKEAYRAEKAKREEELIEEIGAAKTQIRKLSLFAREFSLGEDRSFRKYWIFQFIPGMFVEHVPAEQLNFPCLESLVPAKKPVMEDYLENSTKRRSRKNTKNDNEDSIHEESSSSAATTSTIPRCTGDMSTCTIHGNGASSRPMWSMYAKHQFDSLIDALNVRGTRESELRTALEYERKTIINDNLAHFDPKIFNPDYVEPPPPTPEPESESEAESETVLLENETRKSARILKNIAIEKANLNNNNNSLEKHAAERKMPKLIERKYQNMESFQAHLAAFHTDLAKLAEKIVLGNFSTFDESHWQDWNHEFYSCPDNFDQPAVALKTMISLFKSLAMSLKSFCLLPPLVVTLESSGLNSPSDKENIEVKPVKENFIAERWLDMLKMISNEDGQSESSDSESSHGLSSISQLFVNYSILFKSIKWEVSAEKTASRCSACKRRIVSISERVICDRCNYGYHRSCLKLRSTDELKNNWSCYDCSPRNVPTVPEPSATVEDYQKCGHCRYELKTNENEIHCRSCNKDFHLECTGLSRVPRGTWNCKKCLTKQKKRKESADVDVSGDHEVRRSGRKRRNLVYSDNDDDSDF